MTRISLKALTASALLTLTIFCPQKVDALCKKINNCKCKQPNGKVIDLSSIGNIGGNTPKFPYKTPDGQDWSVWEFSFNGCHGYTDDYCSSSAMACQRSTDHSVTPGFPLGTPETADFTDGSLLKFQALGQDGQYRYVEVKLHCFETADQPTLQTFGEPDFDWIYKYELTSKCACENGCSGGGGGGGLSFGSILCILFPVLVVVYLVGGIIFMKYGKGAEGKEVIPNYDIWIQMPGLVKDGALYVVNVVKPGAEKSGYEDI